MTHTMQKIGTTLVLTAFVVMVLAPVASAAALLNVSVLAPAQTTGTVETWTIQFDAVTAVPLSGDVRIVFPAGFVVSSGAASECDITSPVTVDGESTAVNAGAREVICTLDADDSIAGGDTVTLTITNIKNPTTEQTTGTFTIQTRDGADVVLDDDTSTTVAITPSTLTAVSVGATAETAGTVETWTIGFTTVNEVGASGDIRIAFPSGFQTSSGAPSVCDVTAAGVSDETTTVVSATVVLCNLGAADSIGADVAVTVAITNMKNPTVEQTTGAFTIQTRDSTGAVHDEHTTATATITPNTLTSVTATAPTQATGAVETWTIGFTTVNPVAGSGDIRIVFPAGFATSSGAATDCDVTAPGTVAGETTSVVSGTEVVCDLGAADSIGAGVAVTLTLTNIKNPTSAGTTASFTFETRDSTDAVHDEHTTLTVSISASALSSVTLSPANSFTDAVTTWTIGFTTANPVPGSGDIRIVFPAGFTTSSGAATACDVTAPGTVAAEATTVVSATEVVCNLGAGDSIGAGVSVSLTLTNVENPRSSGTTGAFTIETRDAADSVIDAHGSATAEIRARGGSGGGPSFSPTYQDLGEPIAEPTNSALGATTTWTFTAILSNGIGGVPTIVITFPAGFGLETETSSMCDVSQPAGMDPVAVGYSNNNQTIHCYLGSVDDVPAGETLVVGITEVTNPSTADVEDPILLELFNGNGQVFASAEFDVDLESAAVSSPRPFPEPDFSNDQPPTQPDPTDEPASTTSPTMDSPGASVFASLAILGAAVVAMRRVALRK